MHKKNLQEQVSFNLEDPDSHLFFSGKSGQNHDRICRRLFADNRRENYICRSYLNKVKWLFLMVR